MNMSDPKKLVGVSCPLQMQVSELLLGGYHFIIPSYQRGYRWEYSIGPNDEEIRQVDDLLNDLTDFVDKNANSKANYYLQPLMVKPRYEANGRLVWDVLDGQQRLTTLLLLLKCLNEKLTQGFGLYTIEYANRPDIDFSKITYYRSSPDYNYPLPNKNLDSFFVRKAKDKIEEWYNNTVKISRQRQDKLKEALFYEDNTRLPSSNPNLRAIFIWYNAEPNANQKATISTNTTNDIAIFNRLNGGKISLTNAELLKALYLLCVKVDKAQKGTCIIDEETLVRRWDEMERKFQDNEFWCAVCPKTKTYENRLDFLFDFIRESDSNSKTNSSYRYFYKDMKSLLTKCDSKKLEEKWDVVTRHFDILCKWHESTTLHNYIGFLLDLGMTPAYILKTIKKNAGNAATTTVVNLVKKQVYTNDVFALRYDKDEKLIRRILLLFNVEVSEKHNERFSFHQYRERKYDIEHVNSQTENAIVKPQERLEWIKEQALSALEDDISTMSSSHQDYNTIYQLIQKGNTLYAQGGSIPQKQFDTYRQDVENYYAPKYVRFDKHWIGNLTLLNSSINREYKNALFPMKLRTIKRSDQEGEYIPPCTRYLFLKYYSNIQGNPSSFNTKRWNEDDQNDYANAIYTTLKKFLL